MVPASDSLTPAGPSASTRGLPPATPIGEALAPPPPAEAHFGVLLPALLAVMLVAGLLLAQLRIDFTFNEEGFLWYGAVAVAHGAVPLRDFYSYDPGRYGWAAAWTPLVGEGLLGLRISTAVFAALGLFCGLLAARRAVASRLGLAAVGIVLTLWLLPRNKLFEPAITMAAVLAAVALIERPTARRHCIAGALVGFGVFMGKNHGLYLGVAFFALILLLHLRDGGRGLRRLAGRLGAWTAGILLGAAPLLAMLALVPGFWRSYLDSILFFVHEGRTNFPLPVPWPWRFQYSGLTPWAAAQTFSISFCFLLMAAFFIGGAIAVLCLPGPRLRRHALFAAAVVVGSVYTHHAFSRADLAHLAPSIPPLLLGLVALPRAAGGAAAAILNRRRTPRAPDAASSSATAPDPAGCGDSAPGPAARGTRWLAAASVALALCGITTATAVPAQPFFRVLSGRPSVAAQVAGETLYLRPPTAGLLAWARSAAARIPPGAPVLMAPNLPGLYPFLGRTSPVYDIYPLWPAAGPLDRRMVDELRRHDVAWVILTDATVDRQEELTFANTHPQTWTYLQANFHRIDALDPQNPARCALLQRNNLPGMSGQATAPTAPPGVSRQAAAATDLQGPP